MSALYELKDLRFTYRLDGQEFPALKGLGLTINDGEYVTLAGPSGSGKSTLLNLLGLIEDAPTKSVFFQGEDVHALSEAEKNRLRRFHLGFVFQQFHLFPVLTARENVEYFLIQQGLNPGERKKRVEESLSLVGLSEYAEKRPNQLSGGQRQRVAIARALAKNPRVVIADEPTASLDQKNGENVIDHLLRINREKGVTIIVASHDPMVLAKAPRTVRLRDGQLEGGA